MTKEELFAQADKLIPSSHHPRLNALLKDNPAGFYIDARVKLPKGTTPKALANLAKKLYLLEAKV